MKNIDRQRKEIERILKEGKTFSVINEKVAICNPTTDCEKCELYERYEPCSTKRIKWMFAEEPDIKIGDVFKSKTNKCVITAKNADTYDLIWNDGSIEQCFKEEITKHERIGHIDVKVFLEQIKGE